MILSFISAVAVLSLSYVFVDSALHKFSAPQHFRAALENYRVVPEGLLRPLGQSLPLLEITLGIALLIPAAREFALPGMVFLLSAYTAGMLINIQRGRVDIDCGCNGPARSEGISLWLVGRNVGLVMMAGWVGYFSTLLPTSLGTWSLALASTVVFIFFYHSLTQLRTNNKLQQKVHNHV